MKGLTLKSMSFDDLIALRDNVVRMISAKASSTRRELEAKLAAIEGFGLGGGAIRIGSSRPTVANDAFGVITHIS